VDQGAGAYSSRVSGREARERAARCAEMGEPGGAGPRGSSDGRPRGYAEEAHLKQALVELGLDLRRLPLSAFTREVARRVREVLGAEDLLLAESLARCAALAVANILEEPRHRRSTPLLAPDGRPGLTPRQLEVLRLLDSGMRVNQIKAELNLSEPTVRTHVRAILRAFGAGSQLEALHKARALGFVGGTREVIGTFDVEKPSINHRF
jgi:DNA-binding CsgD family transcriptional regulator